MSADYERKLHGAVAQFVKEADKKYPNWSERNDNGEWEIGLDKFDDMYKVILEIIEYTSCDEATEQMLDDILFGIARDSPSGNYSITLRYDYVSRPYIFKDDTLVFETNKPGYNETVYFKVEWKSEDEIFLYIESDNDKYSNEKYFIKID